MLLFESGLSVNLEPISWLGRPTYKPQERAASDSPALGLPPYAAEPGVYVGAGDPNSDPQGCSQELHQINHLPRPSSFDYAEMLFDSSLPEHPPPDYRMVNLGRHKHSDPWPAYVSETSLALWEWDTFCILSHLSCPPRMWVHQEAVF